MLKFNFKVQIRIFDRENERIHLSKNLLFGSLLSDYEKKCDLVINDRNLLFTNHATYAWLSTEKFIQTQYECKIFNCYMKFDRKTNFDRHVESCQEGVKITTKQKSFGENKSHLERAVELGYLPEKLKDFRLKFISVFDIETMEINSRKEISTRTLIEAQHKLLSLAVSTNIPMKPDKFFCRTSSEPEAEQDLVNRFVEYLGDLHSALADQIPSEIQDAIDKLETDLAALRFGSKKLELTNLQNSLRKYYTLRIYAFNGGTFLILLE